MGFLSVKIGDIEMNLFGNRKKNENPGYTGSDNPWHTQVSRRKWGYRRCLKQGLVMRWCLPTVEQVDPDSHPPRSISHARFQRALRKVADSENCRHASRHRCVCVDHKTGRVTCEGE